METSDLSSGIPSLKDDLYGDNALAHIRLNPLVAVLLGACYSIIAAAAMNTGLKYLQGHPDGSGILQCFAWATGAAIGIALAARLARNQAFLVGAISSLVPSGLWIAFLPLLGHSDEQPVLPSIFGHALSTKQFLIAFALLVLVCGLVGSAMGAARNDGEFIERLIAIPHRHWLWLWIAFFAWVAMLPTAIYYAWLEIITSWYVLIHPSLWFMYFWTEAWTWTLGVCGIAALMYGIDISVRNVSPMQAGGGGSGKRFVMFFLGTFILAGSVANILLRVAIHGLKLLPEGITAHPWWILT